VETNVLFGSVLLTLLFAASLSLTVYCIFFFFQLRYSFSFRGRFWTPTTSSALTTLRASTTLKGRVRLIRAALFASEAEVLERAGAEAGTHLRILRLCLCIALAASLPSLLFLLPLVATGSGTVDANNGFKQFTLTHLDKDRDSLQPALWVIVACVLYNSCCVLAGAAHLQSRVKRTAAGSLGSRCTLLLRSLPRTGFDDGAALQALMESKFSGLVLRVYAHADRRAEVRLVKRLGATTEGAARARLECQLCELRAAPPRGSGVAFVVFVTPAAATAALKALREQRIPIRGGLGELINAALWQLSLLASRLGLPPGELPMRVEPAPLPSSIAWEHCGVSIVRRMFTSLAVNSVLIVILAIISSPALVSEVLYDLNPGADASSDDQALTQIFKGLREYISNVLSGFIFQFLPTLYTLVTMTVVLPALVLWSTRQEGHLTLSGFRQAVLVKAFLFNCVQFIFILSFGRAVTAALVSSLAACDRQTWLGCLLDTGAQLGQSGFESTINSAMGLLCLACSFALAIQLLDFQVLLASLRRRARRLRRFAGRKIAAAHRTMERHKEAARWRELEASGSGAAPPLVEEASETGLDSSEQSVEDEEPFTPIGTTAEEVLRAPLLGGEREVSEHEGDVRAGLPLWQLPFRIMFFQAHDICILTCVLTFSVLSPLIFLPGIVYFAHNWALRKWQFMSCGKAVTTPPDGDKHKAASTMLLNGLFLHTLATCFFVQRTVGGHPGYKAPQFRILAAWAFCLLLYLSSSSFYASLNSRRVAGEEEDPGSTEARTTLLRETAGYAGPDATEVASGEAVKAEEAAACEPQAWSFRFS